MSSSTIAPRPAHPWPPPWVPRGPPEKWNLTKVIQHTKTAIMIELTTIPLYLYAAYSIDVNPKDYPDSDEGRKAVGDAQTAKGHLLHVVVQEMLHLALSGNLLCALDGFIDLYDFHVIPTFPGTILFQEVEMNLNRTDQENLRDFQHIEAPDPLPNLRLLSVNPAAREPHDIPKYRSIGDFYENLQQGLKTLSDGHLNNNPDYQFSPNDVSGPSFAGIVVITDQAIAQTALELIIEQGEGGREIKPGDSHYAIFKALADSADPLPWKLYDVGKNPKTRDYKGLGSPKDFAYTLSLAFDAGFCYLLQNIQRVWGRGGGGAPLHNHLVGNMFGIMLSVMPNLVDILVQQRLNPQQVAAPCFDYYPLKDDGKHENPLEPEDLHAAFLKLVNDATAIAVKNSLPFVKELGEIAASIEKLTPNP